MPDRVYHGQKSTGARWVYKVSFVFKIPANVNLVFWQFLWEKRDWKHTFRSRATHHQSLPLSKILLLLTLKMMVFYSHYSLRWATPPYGWFFQFLRKLYILGLLWRFWMRLLWSKWAALSRQTIWTFDSVFTVVGSVTPCHMPLMLQMIAQLFSAHFAYFYCP